MPSLKQIDDQVFEIENKIRPLFSNLAIFLFTSAIGIAGMVGVILLLLEFYGE